MIPFNGDLILMIELLPAKNINRYIGELVVKFLTLVLCKIN